MAPGSRMRTMHRSAWPVVLVAASSPASGEVAAPVRELAIDAGHSTVAFSVPFLYGAVRGEFDEVHGTILLPADPRAIGTAATAIVIQTASLHTGSAHRDEHLRSDDFFDAARFPVISFHSRTVTPRGAGFVLAGPLTLHGVTREVAIPCAVTLPPTRDPHGMILAAFHGSLELARRDFGIAGGSAHNPWFDALRSATMGDTVTITLEVHAWMPDPDHPEAVLARSLHRVDSLGVDSLASRLGALLARDSIAFRAQAASVDLLGRLMLQRGQVREGSALLHAMARLQPRSATAAVGAGIAEEAKGDAQRAAAWYRAAVGIDSLDYRSVARDARARVPR